VDLDGDGHRDLLSGSYSRTDGDMAGLFQVLYGTADGKFGKAEVLKGTDGQPLIIPTKGDEQLTEKICTRPLTFNSIAAILRASFLTQERMHHAPRPSLFVHSL
jgi:hypothetical protein